MISLCSIRSWINDSVQKKLKFLDIPCWNCCIIRVSDVVNSLLTKSGLLFQGLVKHHFRVQIKQHRREDKVLSDDSSLNSDSRCCLPELWLPVSNIDFEKVSDPYHQFQTYLAIQTTYCVGLCPVSFQNLERTLIWISVLPMIFEILLTLRIMLLTCPIHFGIQVVFLRTSDPHHLKI